MNDLFAQAGLTGKKIVAGIGVFDGVHCGHRKVLTELAAMAQRHDAIPVAMTFDPHPRAVVAPEKAPQLLVSLEERCRLLRIYGAQAVIAVRFTPEFAALSPLDFLRRLLAVPAELQGICVGTQWRFGARAAGNTAILAEYAAAHGIDFSGVAEAVVAGELVSSSAIRRAIAAGKITHGEKLLGRPYRLIGTVESGHHVAGSELRRPTANLCPDAGVLPPDGVYAVRAFVDGDEKARPGIVNIGFAPTFGWQDGRRIEVHMLDFHGNLYGQKLGIEFLSYLRAERTFAGVDELKKQIEKDISEVKKLWK